MAANIPLPPSPANSPVLAHLPLPSQSQLQLQPESSIYPKTPPSLSPLPDSQSVADRFPQISASRVDELAAALLPAFSEDEDFEQLCGLLHDFVEDPRLKTPNISKLLNLSSARKRQDLPRSKHSGSQTSPQAVLTDDAPTASAAEITKLKSEVTQLQSKVKVEEDKRAKSISLLRAVRQKLVQTEKDKAALETSLSEAKSDASIKSSESQREKSRLDEELSRTRIAQEQQLSKMRHSFERETQLMRAQFERDAATKKTQCELDAITAKSAYEREIAARNLKISQLEARVADLSSERDRFFDELQSKHAEIESTTSRHDEIQGRAGELQHQLNDSRDRLAALLEEVDSLRQLSSSQANDENGYRKLLSDLQSQHASEIAMLSGRVSQLEKERTDLEHDLGKTLKARLRDIEQMRNEAHVKSLEYADSMHNMAERNEQILKNNAVIKTLHEQLSVAEQTRATQSISVTKLNNELQKLEAQTSTQTSQIASLESALKAAQEREATIRSQAQSLRDELRKVQSGILSHEHQRSKGVGFFANFSTSTDPTTAPSAGMTEEQLITPSKSSTDTTHNSSQSGLPPIGSNLEAELNFEYLRNTLLQFLEHKEMRPHLVRVLGVILHFTPQETRRLAAKVAS